jgi:lipopolysaccharide biosynthesis protein
MIDIDQELVRRIKASGLFDEAWYLASYADVHKSGLEPIVHYLWLGKRLGRDPSPSQDAKTRLDDIANGGSGMLTGATLVPGSTAESGQSIPHKPAQDDDRFEWAWNDGFAVARGARSPDFAPKAMTPIQRDVNAPKVVAFYLPQFHPIKENDEWWGTGFTEWTNVSKAMPQFRGHHQPRLPLDLGFYDLRNIEVMQAQVDLARTNGIDAFCFHYYWFDGKRLLERPVETYLADAGETLQLPFCLCWANENWTRRWDGSESDVLMAQSHSLDDHANVFQDLNRFFSDHRYLKINGKPIIVIYRPLIIKDLEAMVKIWRRAALEAGLPGIHLVATNSFGFSEPGSIDFDALCEFPPHNVIAAERNHEKKWYNPAHEGLVYDYSEVVDYCTGRLNDLDGQPSAQTYYPTVMMGWDNEARKPGRSNIFDGCTPAQFHRWLDATLAFSRQNHTPGSGLVFVNAWNEWAEGTYLEPDRKYGHAYLWAVRSVLEDRAQPNPALQAIVQQANAMAGERGSEGAICLHLFYPDLIEELAGHIDTLRAAGEGLDVLLSVPMTWSEAHLSQAIRQIKPRRIVLVRNRGRDVLPFLEIAREGRRMGYSYGCKIHSKKSPHVSNGDKWRKSFYSALMSVQRASLARETFDLNPQCGIYAPAAMVKSCRDPATMRDNLDNLSRILARVGGSVGQLDNFIAGTMFWFRFDALSALLENGFDANWFGPELGAIDGTMAHAFERAIVYLTNLGGHKLVDYAEAVFDPYR